MYTHASTPMYIHAFVYTSYDVQSHGAAARGAGAGGCSWLYENITYHMMYSLGAAARGAAAGGAYISMLVHTIGWETQCVRVFRLCLGVRVLSTC